MGKISASLRQNQTPLKEFLIHCAIASAVSVGLTAAFVAVFALVRMNVSLPFAAHQPVTTVLACLAALISAFNVAKKRQKSGLILGVATGGATFLIILILSAIILKLPASEQVIVKLIALISAGGLGGLLGVSKKNKPKKIKAGN